MEEKRKYVRLETLVKVKCNSLSGGSAAPETYTKDLSIGGVRIELNESLQPKTVIGIEIMLPGEGSWLKAKGEVAWQEQVIKKGKVLHETGINFCDLDIRLS